MSIFYWNVTRLCNGMITKVLQFNIFLHLLGCLCRQLADGVGNNSEAGNVYHNNIHENLELTGVIIEISISTSLESLTCIKAITIVK